MSYAARLMVGPGTGRLVRTDSQCLFVPGDVGADPGVVASLLESFRSKKDGERSLVDFVLEHQADAPSFAWLTWAGGDSDEDGGAIRLMVRGHVTVTTDLESVPTLSGDGSTTWVEHRVRRSPESAEIRVGSAATDFSDLSAGTVAAGGFRLVLGERTPVADQAESRAPVTTGRLCPSNHTNPPHLVRCRICDLPVDHDSDTVTVRSPVLAVARFEDGTTAELSGTKVFGRRPQSDHTRLSTPHDLVTIDAPSAVSRTHLIIAASGWTLTVTDCGSRSGTVLVDSQQLDPVALEPWVPHELGVGDLVHLGGPTTMKIEDPTH